MAKKENSYHHKNLRPALISEAVQMIEEAGVASVTMRAIGQRLGVSRGAPYRHFKDKSELLMAVAASGFDRLEEKMAEVLHSNPSSLEDQLIQIGKVYVRFALDNPAYYRLMYGKEALSRWNHPVLKNSADALFLYLLRTIAAYQEEVGVQTKSTQLLVYIAWSTVHGLASLLIEEQIMAEVDMEALLDETMQTMIVGIRN